MTPATMCGMGSVILNDERGRSTHADVGSFSNSETWFRRGITPRDDQNGDEIRVEISLENATVNDPNCK